MEPTTDGDFLHRLYICDQYILSCMSQLMSHAINSSRMAATMQLYSALGVLCIHFCVSDAMSDRIYLPLPYVWCLSVDKTVITI